MGTLLCALARPRSENHRTVVHRVSCKIRTGTRCNNKGCGRLRDLRRDLLSSAAKAIGWVSRVSCYRTEFSYVSLL